MAKAETWYDSQATIAKLITYAALVILAATLVWGIEAAYVVHKFNAALGPNDPPSIAQSYGPAIFTALGGIAISAFLAGIAAIIDLLIVNAEALRSK